MIYDTLNNLPNYLGLVSGLDAVIEFVMARDITALPAGRTRIDGDTAYVTVSTVTPQNADKVPFVRHDAHLTLETDLEGSELFEVSLGELTPTRPADPESDTVTGHSRHQRRRDAVRGTVCPVPRRGGLPHRLKAQGCGKLKKAVFTIQLDEDPEEE